MGYPDYLVHFNKNHDKKTGRFTFGDGNGDGVSPDDYRTPELDKKYNELKKTGVLDFKGQWLMPEDDPNEKWGKDWTKAVDIGLEAIKFRYVWDNPALEINNDTRSWFMFEDQTYGLPEVAYLASKGWSKEAILQTLKDADEMETKNSEFFNAYTGYPNNKNYTKFSKEAHEKEPYDGTYMLMEAPTYMRSSYMDNEYEYIDRCIELAKEMKHTDEYSEYLMHFNKNHDKKSGRFSFGDGDGDGIRDDHSNQSKKQSTSDGSKKTMMISSPKNPRNPFSGRKKTKIEVSDEAYKEFMKSDTKHSIRTGTGNLLNSGLFIAAGVLTENPVVLGLGVAYLVGSTASYVNAGTHFVNKMIDSAYKDKPVEELDTLVRIDPSIFNKKYYDTKTNEIRELSLKDARKETIDRAKKS